MNTNSFFQSANRWLRQSVTIRMITIGILILLLLIPVSMVESLIRERQGRQEEAIREVSSTWGEAQTVTGPVLTVPYKTYSRVVDNDQSGNYRLVESRAYAHFLPSELQVKGEVIPEKRYRGIYEVVVYNTRLVLTGQFKAPSFEEWKIDPQYLITDEAFVALGLSDLRSIQENITIRWNDKELHFNPGVETNDVIPAGVSVRVSDSVSKDVEFEVVMNFNGSSSLNFIPLGRESSVELHSKWGSPKFFGAYLPDTRTVADSGFVAHWKVLHLNRPYPQQFRGSVAGIAESSFGVQLLVPVDEYQKSMRSAKYAVLFIALTFLVFFFIQVLNKVRIHPIQYLMTGLALCVFYTLLIALSEHIPFGWSYLTASVSVIGLITLYSHSIFKKSLLTRLILLILIILYLFIYTIIQMEDYALLMGSIGLFVTLSLVMYLSRKIDWHGTEEINE